MTLNADDYTDELVVIFEWSSLLYWTVFEQRLQILDLHITLLAMVECCFFIR